MWAYIEEYIRQEEKAVYREFLIEEKIKNGDLVPLVNPNYINNKGETKKGIEYRGIYYAFKDKIQSQ